MTPSRFLPLSFVLLLALLPAAGLLAQPALLTNADGRAVTQSLDGPWRVIVDPYENGYYDYRYRPKSNGYFRDAEPASPSDLIEYSFDTADLLHVPGDWNTQRDDLFWYEGTVWYRRLFDYDLAADRRLFVHFGGANYEAIAYLNGERLGRHEGGFTPFQYEVTGLLRKGENSLVVKVDNERRRDAIPTVNTDWWNYGGLTRSVTLVEVPTTFVRDYVVQLDPDDPARVLASVHLDGPLAAGTNVTVRIPGAGVEAAAATDGQGRAVVRLDAAGLQRWTPDDPRRYDVVVEAGEDRVEERIGFRTVEVQGADILLNGEPVFLRGISIHEEAPLRGGRAYSDEDARTLLTWAQQMECNFVRLAHYPHGEYMTRMADSLGLLVWSEIPVYWTILWENEATYALAERQLREMITRDRNRASIILWSVGNETPRSEPRLAFMRRLVETARALDETRLVTAALELHYDGPRTLVIDDPLGEYLDVLGVNEYVGWYDGLPPKADTLQWRVEYDKPLVVSEFGAGARHGLRGGELERWTEDYQQSLYRHQLGMLDRIDVLRGMTPWILMDFRSPRRPLPDVQDYWNRKGLLSPQGDRKLAFYVLQDYYQKRAAR